MHVQSGGGRQASFFLHLASMEERRKRDHFSLFEMYNNIYKEKFELSESCSVLLLGRYTVKVTSTFHTNHSLS